MKKKKCCICNKDFIGYGNNPWPLKEKGLCCDECNKKVVLERFARYGKNVTQKYLEENKNEIS